MTGGIHDINLVLAMVNGEVFGKNSNAALLFQIVAVHDTFGNGFILTVHAGMLQHGIHKRCLAVVYMGNDSDVSDSFLHD